MSSPYRQAYYHCPIETTDAYTDSLLAKGAWSVTVDPETPQTNRLTVTADMDFDTRDAYHSETITDYDWLRDATCTQSDPCVIGDVVIVCRQDTATTVETHGRASLLTIDPEGVFGDGHHMSTRLAGRYLQQVLSHPHTPTTGLLRNKETPCFAMLPHATDVPFLGQCSVAELHKLNENGADGAFRNRAITTLLDVGTGSGILAIIAKHRHPDLHVTGIDCEATATLRARENAAQNHTPCDFYTADIADYLPKERVDMIVANVPTDIQLLLTQRIREWLAPNGYLIISGIWHTWRDTVHDAYVAIGCQCITDGIEEGWYAGIYRMPETRN